MFRPRPGLFEALVGLGRKKAELKLSFYWLSTQKVWPFEVGLGLGLEIGLRSNQG